MNEDDLPVRLETDRHDPTPHASVQIEGVKDQPLNFDGEFKSLHVAEDGTVTVTLK